MYHISRKEAKTLGLKVDNRPAYSQKPAKRVHITNEERKQESEDAKARTTFAIMQHKLGR